MTDTTTYQIRCTGCDRTREVHADGGRETGVCVADTRHTPRSKAVAMQKRADPCPSCGEERSAIKPKDD